MNLVDVWDELGAVLATLDGVRVYDRPQSKIDVPGAGAAVVLGYPDEINYDQTYGRGSDEITQPVLVVVADPTSPRTAESIARWAAGGGPTSIKGCVEAGAYTAFDSVRVERGDFDVYTMAGKPVMVAIFMCTIIGDGAS